MNDKYIKVLYFLFLFLFGCTAGKNRTQVELIQDMMKQKNLKPQRQEGGLGMQLPPEGAKALNRDYYPYKNDLDAAIRYLKNPLRNNFSPEVVLIGQRNYQKACIYCHGERGDGEGSMKPVMNAPPASLLTEKARRYSDAQIYHIIHEGQGLMGSHRLQVRTERERWALVNYVRNLQKMNR